MINIHHIGNNSSIPNWPTNNLEGLLDALNRWPLDPCLNMQVSAIEEGHLDAKPYCDRAWGGCAGHYNAKLKRTVYTATVPLYPEAPDALRYWGNFIGYSFGFTLDTDDPELIARLDAAISANLAKFQR